MTALPSLQDCKTRSAAIAKGGGPDPREAEYRIQQQQRLWCLIESGQLVKAYWYLDALRTETTELDLPPAQLLRAAALAPFVTDDASAAATTYHDTLTALDLQALEVRFKLRGTFGLYACVLAASLQGALFFPISGAARLLRLSNHDLPPDLSRLCFALANLGEQGICCTLADFAPAGADAADDASYRRAQVRPLVQDCLIQLPRAIEFFRDAGARQARLEDRAGSELALKALTALYTILGGVRPKQWNRWELAQWLALPQLARAESSGEINFTPIADRIALVSYAALAQSTIKNGHFNRAQALLYELERAGSGESYVLELRSCVRQGLTCIRNCGEEVARLPERLLGAFNLGLISAHDYQAYRDWLEALEIKLQCSPENPHVLLAELRGIGSELDEHYSTRVARSLR